MKLKNSIKIIALSAIASALFIGCGESSDSTATAVTPLTGTFIDAPVQGLKYVTASQNDYTNVNGEFKYVAGEDVEFFLGNLSLGKTKAGTLLTPYSISDNNVTATNIALLLQNFDGNRSNTQVLDLAKLKDYNLSNFDLSADNDTVKGQIDILFADKGFSAFRDDINNSVLIPSDVKNKMDAYITSYNLERGYGLSYGVNYAGNLDLSASDVVAKFLESSFNIEYAKPGNVEGTLFNNHYVLFLKTFDPLF